MLASEPTFQLIMQDLTEQMSDAESPGDRLDILRLILIVERCANEDALKDIAQKLAYSPSDLDAARLTAQAKIFEAELPRLSSNSTRPSRCS